MSHKGNPYQPTSTETVCLTNRVFVEFVRTLCFNACNGEVLALRDYFPYWQKGLERQKKIVCRSRSAACVVRRAAWTLWHLVTIELWGGSIL